jgi:competence protein ComEA
VPSFTLTRARAAAAAVGAIAVVLLAARFLLPPQPAPAPAAAPARAAAVPRAAEVVVHVVGAVRTPGLYRLAQGKRVADAVARAGGPTRRADQSAVNLAAPLADGQQVVVPARPPPAPAAEGTAPAGGDTAPAGPVHLNTATLEQLDSLPGVGPVTAQKILDYREAHGAFSAVDELDAIAGIGPARLESLREVVAP